MNFDKSRIKDIERKVAVGALDSLTDEDKMYYRDYRNDLYNKEVAEIRNGYSTPYDALVNKYKDTLSKEEVTFINCHVLLNLSYEQSVLFAYPGLIESTRLFRNYRISCILKRPAVINYKRDLEEYLFKEGVRQNKWTKDLALNKLMNIVESIEDDLRPQIDDNGDVIKPTITKTQSDTLLGAIKELNSIEGINAPNKTELSISPVTFINGDEMPEDE